MTSLQNSLSSESKGATGFSDSQTSGEKVQNLKESLQSCNQYQYARFLREVAGLLIVFLHTMTPSWKDLLMRAGISKIEIEEIEAQHPEPEIQAYKILSFLRDSTGNDEIWWENFLKSVKEFGRTDISQAIQQAYDKFINGEPVVNSTLSSDADWMKTPMVIDDKFTLSFEAVNESISTPSNSMKSRLREELEVEVGNPEIAQQIEKVRKTIQEVADANTNMKISSKLTDVVPQIMNMEKQFQMSKTLNTIYEQENQHHKDQVKKLDKENQDLKETNDALEKELEEVKKTKADKQLDEFDVITRNDVTRTPSEQPIMKEGVEGASKNPDGSNYVSFDAYKQLQQKCGKLRSQLDHVVKVNYSWDAEYRKMEAMLREENDTICKELRGKDEEIMTLKKYIENMEKDLDYLKQKYQDVERKLTQEQSNSKKYSEYAQQLGTQRKKLESEVKRLNDALAESMAQRLADKKLPKAAAEPQRVIQVTGPPKHPRHTSGKAQQDIAQEVELYRQQVEVFAKDFHKERVDRQRLMGELSTTQDELHCTKKKLSKIQKKLQMYEDEQLAQKLQADLNLAEDRRRPPSTRRERLTPHGNFTADGVNFAGNDMFIDGARQSPPAREPSAPRSQDSSEGDENECPRCRCHFSTERNLHEHLDSCLNYED